MRIDVHAHHLPASYLEMLRKGDGPSGAAHDASTLEKMIGGQLAAGIDLQVLSSGPHSPYLKDRSAADQAAKSINDSYKVIVDRHQGRFAAYASLPLPHADVATREAIRCLDGLGFAGVHMGCSALGRAVDDPSYAELWSELDAREAVVYLHPGGVVVGTEPGLSGMNDPIIAVTIGSGAEIATAALRLAALSRTHRRVRFIIGLLGGSLPFLLQRVVRVAARRSSELFPGPSEADGWNLVEALRRFHYDINLLPDPAVIGSARQAYGADRFVFGSDAPSGTPELAIQFMRDGGLSEAECDDILGPNAIEVFGERIKPQARLQSQRPEPQTQ